MILSTERLLLREFKESDWHAVFNYQADAEYLRYAHWTHRTEQDVHAFVRMFINWSREQPRRKFQLAIILKDENRLIGNCGIRKQTAHTQVAELGYEIDRRYWGCGYATEAAQELIKYGFTQLALHRIWAYCIAENVASAHVMERLGMHYEGRMRESEWMKGRWWDTLLYSILDHEWWDHSTDSTGAIYKPFGRDL